MSVRPPYAPTGEPPAHDLPQRGDIGMDGKSLLGTSPGDAETAHDFVKNQKGAVMLGPFSQRGEEFGRRSNDSHISRDRLDDNAGNLACMLLKCLLQTLWIVVLQHDRVLARPGRHPRRIGHG